MNSIYNWVQMGALAKTILWSLKINSKHCYYEIKIKNKLKIVAEMTEKAFKSIVQRCNS